MSESLPVHVGLNASLLSLGENYRGAGINWYIYHLLCHLPEADPGLRYTAFLSDARFRPPPGLRVKRPLWSTQSPLPRITWEQLVAPWALRRERVDVLHAMAFVSPMLSRLPAVITVFDLSFLKFPQAFKPANRFYLRTMTRISVRQAEQVIAISEYTRQDVIARLGVPAERVQTVYCGVDATFVPLPPADIAAFKTEKGLPERFVLFLGTIEPRKNVVRLIEAFALLAKALPDVDLVVAGGKGWFFEPVFARAQELGLAGRVHFPGYVPEAEKPLWYNAAEVFCYPSLYEGFGLPPLEAMACGTPVISSNAASLPEVVGEAGIMVDPQDTAGLSEAMQALLESAALRSELAGRGCTRARQFNWPETARQTARIYHLAKRQASVARRDPAVEA